MSEYYRCDTVKKQFGMVQNNNETKPHRLKLMFQVDDKIVNPLRRYEFIINGYEVPLPKTHSFPFAILNSGKVKVFWAASDVQRSLWVKAIRSLAGPEAGTMSDQILEQNQITVTKDNFFAA